MGVALSLGLRASGYQVDQALDADLGVRRAAASKPGVILINGDAPNASGVETCARIRAIGPLSRTPMILMTSSENSTTKEAAAALGVAAVVAQPQEHEVLIDLVELVANGDAEIVDGWDALLDDGRAA